MATVLNKLQVQRRFAAKVFCGWDPRRPLSDEQESTFRKILIANRGEIACRIIRTARRMGIATVAVYSNVDAHSKHVKLADESVLIGEAQAGSSYLDMRRILGAVKSSGAEAVHPGYGFLSENAAFVQLLEEEGVAFIGPSAKAITEMGDKLESKRLAMDAGVNTIPGFDGVVKDADHCVRIAQDIGYPVMVKATAGGGGKGMRIAFDEEQVREGYKLSSQEALSSFGDSRLIVEKYITNPRHIEIQVLGDKHGNIIHLNERECSIQRRNQKVIEEAPSTFLDQSTRQEMTKQAINLCKKLKYHSAGTVEFLVDSNKNFYFLEMNTRLQVEHPITEAITKTDLVEEMIRIAKGYRLKLKQSDVAINGWALEARIYAEDAEKSFGTPSTGRIYKYQEPETRCESGVQNGSPITLYYDPLISKVITHAETRSEAINKMIEALDSYIIQGVTHNIPLLRDILIQEKFLKGEISTNYLSETYPYGFKGHQLSQEDVSNLIAITSCLSARNINKTRCSNPLTAWSFSVELNETKYNVKVERLGKHWKIFIDKKEMILSKMELDQATLNQKQIRFQVANKNALGEYQIVFNGSTFKLKVLEKRVTEFLDLLPAKPKLDYSKEIKAPMPGLVLSVSCKVGEIVSKSQELLVLEAMKMQNSLTSPGTGKVKSVNIKAGDTVGDEDVLVELE